MNPRTSDDPELQAALRAWDSASSSRESAFDESMRIRTALRDSSSHQAFGWAALTSGRISAHHGEVETAFASADLLIADAMVLEAQSNHQSAIELAKQVLKQPIEVVKRAAHLFSVLLLTRSYSAMGRKSESTKWKEWANNLPCVDPLGGMLAIQIRANLRVEPTVEPLTDRELVRLSLSAHCQKSADIA